MQFSSPCSSIMAISETEFLLTFATHNGQMSYVRHVLDPIHVLFTLFGCLDVGKGLAHNLLMQSSRQLKNGNFQNRFF